MSEQPSNPSSELQVSRNKEPIFRKFVYDTLDRVGYALLEELIYSGAEIAEISPVTAKRYLDKMCSRMGKCESDTNEFGITLIKYKRQDPPVSTTDITS